MQNKVHRFRLAHTAEIRTEKHPFPLFNRQPRIAIFTRNLTAMAYIDAELCQRTHHMVSRRIVTKNAQIGSRCIQHRRIHAEIERVASRIPYTPVFIFIDNVVAYANDFH